jgi:hypothetical protein
MAISKGESYGKEMFVGFGSCGGGRRLETVICTVLYCRYYFDNFFTPCRKR